MCAKHTTIVDESATHVRYVQLSHSQTRNFKHIHHNIKLLSARALLKTTTLSENIMETLPQNALITRSKPRFDVPSNDCLSSVGNLLEWSERGGEDEVLFKHQREIKIS